MSALTMHKQEGSDGARTAAAPHVSGRHAKDEWDTIQPQPQRRFAFAIRTTLAALLALTSCELLGIHHPWWAAMTVWLVAQPTRGLLIERSLARLAGTICGAIAGAMLLIFWAQHLPVALMGLALWLACCAGLGTIFRHFRNYGFVLAGYTAAIVVLFGLGGGDADGLLAQHRVVCTLIGILCSALFSIRVLPSKALDFEAQALSLLGRVLQRIENGPQATQGSQADASLVAAIGTFNHTIDERAAGSIRRRAGALRLRHISVILLELMALASSERHIITASAGRQEDPLRWVQLLAANAASSGQLALASALGDLALALAPDWRVAWRHFRSDFDVVTAFRAASRPVLALAIATALWLSTGWQAGAMMAMTAVLFTSLFSSHDNGNDMVVQVLIGTLAGAAVGLLVRLLLLPYADGLLPALVCITPFLLAAAWLMRQPATAKMAIDMAMTFLLTVQPGTAPVTVETAMAEAAAIVAGVLIAVVIFWLILPSTPEVRSRRLASRTARLARLIGRDCDNSVSRSRYEALRVTQMRLLDVAKASSPIFTAAQACLAAAAEVRSRNSKSARETALRASAALDALITSSTRKNSNV